ALELLLSELVGYVMSLPRDKALTVADSCCDPLAGVARAAGVLTAPSLFCGIVGNLMRNRLREAGNAFKYYAYCCRAERVKIDSAGLIEGHKRLKAGKLIDPSIGLSKHGFWRSLRDKDD